MRSSLTRTAITAAGAALVAGTLAAPAQAATSVVQVRAADLTAPSGTADGGVQEFLAQGVRLKTVNATGYARGTFKVGVPLAQVSKVDFTWYGTDFSPGIKYLIDADGDGKVDGELRGEDVYGDQDVWLNQDTQAFPESALADNFFATHAPCNVATPAPGVTDPCGSSGADAHGTLANWATKLQAATGKAPVVVSGGWSLTGDRGDGVLAQITYGPNQYVFTSSAKAKVAVKAEPKRDKIRKKNKAKIVGTVDPASEGAAMTLQVKKAGKWETVKVRKVKANGQFKLGAKPVKVGVNRFRVLVAETNSTAAATSNVVKVRVTK